MLMAPSWISHAYVTTSANYWLAGQPAKWQQPRHQKYKNEENEEANSQSDSELDRLASKSGRRFEAQSTLRDSSLVLTEVYVSMLSIKTHSIVTHNPSLIDTHVLHLSDEGSNLIYNT
jgi:hypothetical protein